jgi:hypothetical protein
MVNARLLAEGHAIAVSADHGHLDEFLALDDAAHAARLGLWAADACGPRAEGPAVIADIDADPAGPDGDPEAGESAGVTNPGDAGVDLSGWMLRDESSVHRYVFPPGTILGPGETIRVFSVCGHHPHCFGTEPVWSNGGDTGLLLDPRGNVADRLRYRG